MRAFVLALVAALIVPGLLPVQSPTARAATFSYADRFGGTGFDSGDGVAFDGFGNAYVVGYFEGTVDFDPGAGTANLTSAGDRDIFAVKLNPTGGLVWARQFGSIGEDRARSVAVDGLGNVYVAGDFHGVVDFDPGPSVFNLVAWELAFDAFLVRLSTNGNFIWARQFGSNDEDHAIAVATDQGANAYLIGSFRLTVDFDPGPGTALLESEGGYDAFVVKLGQAGDFNWAARFGGTDSDFHDYGVGIAVDGAGNVYATGAFWGTTDFDPGPGTFLLTCSGDLDGFIVKLNGADGGLIWAGAICGTGAETFVNSVAVDGVGNVYATGTFHGGADLDPGAGTLMFTSNGSYDGFATKWNASGGLVWARQFGGIDFDGAADIALDQSANVYLTGEFRGMVDFDPGPGALNVTSLGTQDAFAVKLDTGGGLVWARQFGGGSSQASGSEIAVNHVGSHSGSVYLAGSFFGSIDFDPGAGTVGQTSAGNNDAFAMKLAQVAPPVNTVPGSQTTAEDTPLVLSAANGNRVSIADPDNGSSPLRVTLAATNGVLTLGGTAGLTFDQGNGTANPTMAFSGTLTAINAALTTLTFKPTGNFNGAAALQVNTSDLLGPGGGQVDADTVAITVTPVNDPPTAAPDAYSTPAQQVLTVAAPGVLANDTDIDSTPLTAVLVGNPASGTLSLSPNGGFTYTPTQGFAGADSFTYVASDGAATNGSIITVAITVTPTACAPRPRVETAVASGGGALNATVRATPLNGAGSNLISELRFGTFENARVTLNGQPIASGQAVPITPNAATVSLVVQRANPTPPGQPPQPTTVPLTVVDGCGAWNTLVGGGPGAGF